MKCVCTLAYISSVHNCCSCSFSVFTLCSDYCYHFCFLMGWWSQNLTWVTFFCHNVFRPGSKNSSICQPLYVSYKIVIVDFRLQRMLICFLNFRNVFVKFVIWLRVNCTHFWPPLGLFILLRIVCLARWTALKEKAHMRWILQFPVKWKKLFVKWGEHAV
jgi:hypothetical protein